MNNPKILKAARLLAQAAELCVEAELLLKKIDLDEYPDRDNRSKEAGDLCSDADRLASKLEDTYWKMRREA